MLLGPKSAHRINRCFHLSPSASNVHLVVIVRKFTKTVYSYYSWALIKICVPCDLNYNCHAINWYVNRDVCVCVYIGTVDIKLTVDYSVDSTESLWLS